MNITVTREDLATGSNEGTVIMITGTSENGARVTFAGDQRQMAAMIMAVVTEGQATAVVDAWQVLAATS